MLPNASRSDRAASRRRLLRYAATVSSLVKIQKIVANCQRPEAVVLLISILRRLSDPERASCQASLELPAVSAGAECSDCCGGRDVLPVELNS